MFKYLSIEFKKEYMNHEKKMITEEKKELYLQKLRLKKQLENQKKDEEFRNKLYENYLEKQHLLEIRQAELDKKYFLRKVKIDKNKQKITKKFAIKSQQRELKSSMARIKQEQIIEKKLDKFNKKQKNIEMHQEYNKIKKQQEILKSKQKQEEKEKKNFEIKEKLQKLMDQKKLKVLRKFRDIDLNIEKQKEINQHKIKAESFRNAEKKMDVDESIKELQLKSDFKNQLILSNIFNKQKKAENFKHIKFNLNQQKIKYRDHLKNKRFFLLSKVKNILDQYKHYDNDEIYKLVFDEDELKILNESNVKRCNTVNYKKRRFNDDFNSNNSSQSKPKNLGQHKFDI